MAIDTEDLIEQQNERTLHAYHDVFTHGLGVDVLEDLRAAFIDRASVALEEEMEQKFPHPYLAYVEIGQRMVVQKIQAAIREVEERKQLEAGFAPPTQDQETEL